MNYTIDLSSQASKDLDKLDRPTRQRVARRIDELGADPFDPRISQALTNIADLRKSRVGGWRIIFRVDRGELVVLVLMIARRGQVYQRI